MKEYRVFTVRMAHYLTSKGFRFIRVVQDIKKPNFNNWIFEYSEELQAAIDEYLAAK